MSFRRALILVAFCLVAHGQNAWAQAVQQTTLEKVREYRAVYLGYRDTGVPFSYLGKDDPQGFSIDLCLKIVDAVKDSLGDPAIRVVYVPVSSTLRFMMLQAGVIDLECGSTTNTKIRQQSVAFSVTMFVSGVKAAVRSDAPMSQIKDLDGKIVLTLGGTSTENVVRNALARRKVSGVQGTVRTYAQAMDQVLGGHADAFVTDDALMAGLIASSPNPERFKLLDDSFGFEPYGIGLRKNDPAFKQIVDDTLKTMMKNGEFARLYDKWFMSPIPPKGINLRIPMSELLKQLVLNPNDEGN